MDDGSEAEGTIGGADASKLGGSVLPIGADWFEPEVNITEGAWGMAAEGLAPPGLMGDLMEGLVSGATGLGPQGIPLADALPLPDAPGPSAGTVEEPEFGLNPFNPNDPHANELDPD